MAKLPTELTAEYDRLVMLDNWEGIDLLLSPLIQSGDAEALYLWSMSSLPSEAEGQFHGESLAVRSFFSPSSSYDLLLTVEVDGFDPSSLDTSLAAVSDRWL